MKVKGEGEEMFEDFITSLLRQDSAWMKIPGFEYLLPDNYETIKATEILAKEGFIAYEIGYDQAADLEKIADDNGFSCEIYKDLGGCDRAALLRKK